MGITDKDRKILWGRSGNRCALCRRVLVAEMTPLDPEAVVGDEAHIAARSPGGPRYGECHPDLVDSYENLILLCRVDHKKVDDQPQHYTADRLRQTKAEHEKWVENALGYGPERPGRIQDLLRETTVDGKVPSLRELSDEILGATPTKYTKACVAPYVQRPATDSALRDKLRSEQQPYPFVVLVGDPKAGKSRTMIEAARAVFDSPLLLIPKDGPALEALATTPPDQNFQSPPVIVWLDELTAATLNHLTGATLAALARWATIAGTMTWQRYEQVLYSNNEIALTARSALRRAQMVELAFDAEEAELVAARALYPDEQFTGSIAETLVAGEALVARLKAGRATNPLGVAVVQAVVDWKRSGMDRPIRRSELGRFLPAYLDALGVHLTVSPEHLEGGLKWALSPVASHVALIRESHYARDKLDDETDEEVLRFHEEELGLYDESGWVAFDYIVSATDTPGGLHREIPDQTWRTLADMLTGPETSDVGLVATMRGRLDVTELIIDKSLDKFSRRLCSGFGFDYLKRGEYDKAEQIYIEAIDSGDPSLMSEGHAYLGELFFQLGRTNEAITHFKMVTDLSTLPGTVSTLTLGVALQEERSDLDGAEEAFSKVVEHGDKRLLAVAAGRLAWLRLHRDDNVGAIEICRRGLESTKDDQESTLLFLLASALRREGRLQEAEPVAVRAANHCGPEDGFQSWSLLGAIREELGDPRGALRAYNRAITFDAPEGQSREQNQE